MWHIGAGRGGVCVWVGGWVGGGAATLGHAGALVAVAPTHPVVGLQSSSSVLPLWLTKMVSGMTGCEFGQM